MGGANSSLDGAIGAPWGHKGERRRTFIIDNYKIIIKLLLTTDLALVVAVQQLDL